MTLPLEYSKQESSLKPSGVTEEYIRLQVRLRPELNKIIIEDIDYERLIEALAEGRLLGLQTKSGINIGQFQIGLSGAYPASNFKSPTVSDAKIGFRSTPHILKRIREIMTFEQVPAVTNSPQISSIMFTGIFNGVQTEYNNQIPLNSSGVLKISGTNFIKDGMKVDVVQFISSSGKGHSQPLNFTLNSGTKHIEILISNEQLLTKDFDSGITPLPSYTRIMIAQADNPTRSAFFDFEFLAPPIPTS